jgi:hypothetical protein
MAFACNGWDVVVAAAGSPARSERRGVAVGIAFDPVGLAARCALAALVTDEAGPASMAAP